MPLADSSSGDGQWESYDVINTVFIKGGLGVFQKYYEPQLYESFISIPKAKFEDLQVQ